MTSLVKRMTDRPLRWREVKMHTHLKVKEYYERLYDLAKSLSRILDIHLTNVAVQKTAPDYDPEKGSKWSVQQLRRYLVAKHGQRAVSIECEV